MIHFSYLKNYSGYKTILVFLVIASLFFSFCKEDPNIWKLRSEEQVIGNFLDNNPDKYSEFSKLIESTGLSALMKIRGPYTVMVPNNEAMFKYYEKYNVTSFMDFPDTSIRYDLAYNHIISSELNSSDIGLGALRDPNGLGDFLVTEFEGADIIVNKSARIIDRDIRCSNGYIHEIDEVLEPTIKNIYELVALNPSFKIFAEGLNLTGIKDTLSIIKFQYNNKIARTRYTLLAVPDTIFERYGITDVNKLIEWCRTNDSIASNDAEYKYTDDLKSLKNPFYRYMEYHCLNGTYYLNTFQTNLYPILSYDNNVSMTITTDYKINLNAVSREYTAFIVPACNIPAKNGSLHSISDLLPVIDPDPIAIKYETTDFFDFKQGYWFDTQYEQFSNVTDSFENIHWVGDYLQYHWKKNGTGGVLINDDCLQMIGWFSLSVTFPKVMKGKWEVGIYQPNWGDVTSCNVYIDDVLCETKYLGNLPSAGPGGLQAIAEVDFKTTTTHTIRMENYYYGMIFWDYVQFTPIK